MARTLLERNQEILARVRNLSPLADRVRDIFLRGKREHLREGTDATGRLFVPLARITLDQPRASSTPFLRRGDSSTILVGYRVDVSLGSASLIVQAGWPGVDWVKYHQTGTRRMPRRDPTGFREEDKRKAITLLREYVFNG